MNTSPLNGPLETGLRVLVMLNALHPHGADIGRLVLLDYCVLHSSDVGGPSSLHPAAPNRAGEFGVKRVAIENGLEAMTRVGLVTIAALGSGIEFAASDGAGPFLELLKAEYSVALAEKAAWVADRFGNLSEDEFRTEMQIVVGSWEPEFETMNEHGRLL